MTTHDELESESDDITPATLWQRIGSIEGPKYPMVYWIFPGGDRKLYKAAGVIARVEDGRVIVSPSSSQYGVLTIHGDFVLVAVES